jgi:CubicO group peptidase (beta-lactamase class C family)
VTRRARTTFSVAKGYLALLAGLAVAVGLITNIDEPLPATVKGPWFASAQNLRHLAPSPAAVERMGGLWGKTDQIDHNRQAGIGADQGPAPRAGGPGAHFEYNVRVNLPAFCLLRAFGRPLPDVLRERVMDPIGASRTWEWRAIPGRGRRSAGGVPSLAGGGCWGGGMMIAARKLWPADGARLTLGHAPDPVQDLGPASPVSHQPWLRLPVVAQCRASGSARRIASSVFALAAATT